MGRNLWHEGLAARRDTLRSIVRYATEMLRNGLRRDRGMITVLMLLFAANAFSHHSFAMFDHEKSTTLTGTVKDFQWTNPHCWIQLLVQGVDGAPAEEWGIELDSPRSLVRSGWKPRLIQFGDKVTVVVHPKRDGTKAGGYVSGIAADGTVLPPKGK